jgi:galactan 5-O-arabinofuranosyltransferase
MERVLDDLDGPPGQPADSSSSREQPVSDREKSADSQPDSVPPRGKGVLLRGLVAVRPLIFAAVVGLAVFGIHQIGIAAEFNPYSGRVQYGLRTVPLIVAALAGGAMWWAHKRGWTWDADLIPALFGGLGALTILTALHGTPFDLYGLIGDQLFRTEYVTRFADSWWGGDYTYRDLPAYYAPAFFWVLGRAADLTGTAPWRMLKFGTVAVAFVAPIVSYLLWRRIVTPRVAALISAAALIVASLSESYAWIVLVVFVPWWLMAGHELYRPGVRRWHPVVLGLIGAVLFTTYYYYFFLLPIALCLYLADARWRGQFSWRQTSRTFITLGVAALGSAVFWAPLAWNFLTAPHFESLNNRWITLNSGKLALPMLEPTVIGALCLIGLVFLLATVKEALSRALLIVLVSLYVWHAVGFLFMALDKPLMSFRMRELVPVVLLAAAAMAAARVASYAADHFSADVVWRFAVVGTVLLAVFTGNRFVDLVLTDARNAHNQSLPNGQLPPFHEADAEPWRAAPPERLHEVIEAGYKGPGRPVILTSHSDLLALYPYYGFVQWNANYSHPTSQFHRRLEFLEEVAKSSSPAEFAARLRDNPYDDIDVLALQSDEDVLTFKPRDDAFPFGTRVRQIDFPRRLVQPEYFEITTVDSTVVAVLR